MKTNKLAALHVRVPLGVAFLESRGRARGSPGGAALFADTVVLGAAVSVGYHAARLPLLPPVRHGVPLRARLSLQGEGQTRETGEVLDTSLHRTYYISIYLMGGLGVTVPHTHRLLTNTRYQFNMLYTDNHLMTVVFLFNQ